MLYITGDTHGNQLKWLEQIHPALSPGDGVIVAGDFGYGFWSGPLGSEDAFYDWLAAQPYAVFFIDGNHENFARLLALPVEPWRGGRIQRIRPNVIHLMRGEVYLIEGRTVFTFGGGHSADFWRRKPGASWWPQEMPEPEEYRRASESLRRVHGRVDYIVTHAAPLETGYYLSALHPGNIRPPRPEELPLTSFLEDVRHVTDYRRWYFGHLHTDQELWWRGQAAVFDALRELDSGKVVRQWSRYEG